MIHKYFLRYLDRFSARSNNPNWVTDPTTYYEDNILERVAALQELGYLVEVTFVKKEVDLEQEF